MQVGVYSMRNAVVHERKSLHNFTGGDCGDELEWELCVGQYVLGVV